MSASRELEPLRLEEALRLLPELEVLGPLRATLIAMSRAQAVEDPYNTFGKRELGHRELRSLASRAIADAQGRARILYPIAEEALAHQQRRDQAAAVRALIRGGDAERHLDRLGQALEWYQQAHAIARGLRDRQPEIEALWSMGRLELERGWLERAGRFFQRALALAEEEMDAGGAARACQGLSAVARELTQWQGAEAWCTAGLEHAAGDPVLVASLELDLARAARGRGELALALARLAQARSGFDACADQRSTMLCLEESAQIEARLGHQIEALSSYREALDMLGHAGQDAGLEIELRLGIGRVYLGCDRLPDGLDAVRRAEATAIAHGRLSRLARVYSLRARILAAQGDEMSFVFFENAAEFSRSPESLPRLEGQIYMEYSAFREQVGDIDQARACLERACELFAAVGDVAALARAESESGRIQPNV